MPERQKLAVLMGGPSPEHEVSLATGAVIVDALDRGRFDLQPFLLGRGFEWRTHGRPLASEDFPFDPEALRALDPLPRTRAFEELAACDAVFVALHGTFGEDGVVQGLLEFLGVPYTGSTVAASALAMDKIHSKEVFERHRVPTPAWRVVYESAWRDDPEPILDDLHRDLGADVIVKAPLLGSSVGVYVCRDRAALRAALPRALAPDGRALVEVLEPGREVTCAVLGGMPGEGPEALPPTEIVPPEGRCFDYEAKYTSGMTQEITPPAMPPETIAQIQALALQVHTVMGLGGMSRSDMMVSDAGHVTLFEVNTIPGMTETSLYPQAAAAVGMDFPSLLTRLVDLAVADFADRRRRLYAEGSDQASHPRFPGRGSPEDPPDPAPEVSEARR